MAIIITYDLSGRWTDIKNYMINNKGYFKAFTNQEGTVNLPETTLFHPNKSTDDAIRDLKAVASAHGEHVKRAIATYLRTDWHAIQGEPL